MLFSIGDIHGRFDLLETIHKKIMEHSQQYDEIHTIICLGDYVDRGPQSKEVIEFLQTNPFTGFKHVYLKGNHEDMLIKSLYINADNVIYDKYQQNIRAARDIFLGNGGDKTLKSFGVENPAILLYNKDSLNEIFLPYKQFFDGLLDFYESNGYYFVHAGIVPGIPFDQQDCNAILWIRDKFLNSDIDHGPMIIHGHTPTITRGIGTTPEIKSNRINIDTGAYYTGILTAVCLDEDHKLPPQFINT